MTERIVESARREVSRCRAALSGGSPRSFWVRRLRVAITELRQAVGLLEQQLVDMGEVQRQ